MNLLALTYDQVLAEFQRRYGRGHFHAAAFYRAAFRRPNLRVADLPAFSGGVFASRVQQDLAVELPEIIRTRNREGVVKLGLRLADGAAVETVILSMPHHGTVCISSQVGCRMGCRFCHTGRLGLVRQLDAGEMVAQVYLARVVLGHAVRNVVFMGMGEPLDNWDHVAQALRVLTDQRGLDIPLRRITLSTIGLAAGWAKLAETRWSGLGIALSLNAPDDPLRHHLMPATRSMTLDDLKAELHARPRVKGRVFFIAYVLIKDINDSTAQAGRLAAYLSGLPVKVNLIPYNAAESAAYAAPSAAQVERFRRVLVDAGIFVRLRGTKGEEIQAACGQLGGAGSAAA